MSVLSHDEILRAIKEKKVQIEPFDQQAVGPASIDLHLGTIFRVFKQVKDVFEVTENADFEKITEIVHAKEQFLLLPGQVVHGITIEKIHLPPTLCGRIEGRSRFGRLGLMVHITASFIQPGTLGHQVLEMNNAGPVPLLLIPGVAICQLILEEVRGSAAYVGRFKGQDQP